jgi:hypothetical protein
MDSNGIMLTPGSKKIHQELSGEQHTTPSAYFSL